MPPHNGHSILGASSAARWMNCPGSVRLSRDIERTTSVYAEEGTAAHALAEWCLRRGEDAEKYRGNFLAAGKDGYIVQLGAAGEGFEITEEMVDAVREYLDTIRADMIDNPHSKLEIEKQFKLDEFYPGMWGTNDAMLVEPYGKLIIYDFKYGRGHVVNVEENPQLQYYALGGYLGSDCEEVELVIVQPRGRHKDGTVRRWNIGIDNLLEWAKGELIPAAEATEPRDAPCIVGPWCADTFCPVQGACAAVLGFAKDVVQSDLSTVELPNPDTLSQNDLIRVLDSTGLLRSWLTGVEGYAQALLEKGESIPGYKLVRKRAYRRWADEQKTIDYLTAKAGKKLMIYEQKLRSPAQMEKAIKTLKLPVIIEDLIETPEGGLTIAPESDKRPAVETGPVTDMFDDATDF